MCHEIRSFIFLQIFFLGNNYDYVWARDKITKNKVEYDFLIAVFINMSTITKVNIEIGRLKILYFKIIYFLLNTLLEQLVTVQTSAIIQKFISSRSNSLPKFIIYEERCNKLELVLLSFKVWYFFNDIIDSEYT